MGSQRVGYDWSDLAARSFPNYQESPSSLPEARGMRKLQLMTPSGRFSMPADVATAAWTSSASPSPPFSLPTSECLDYVLRVIVFGPLPISWHKGHCIKTDKLPRSSLMKSRSESRRTLFGLMDNREWPSWCLDSVLFQAPSLSLSPFSFSSFFPSFFLLDEYKFLKDSFSFPNRTNLLENKKGLYKQSGRLKTRD